MIAVVAIPEEDDYVWRVSSQKVPHLTLMTLGESAAGLNLPAMTSYLQHVVNTTMCRFGMSVDRRGELGPKQADVLFFDEHNMQLLTDFRSFLLKDPNFNTAFNSSPQFAEFTPHLTLGYPETPANPDTRDTPGIHWVQFDKIALWTEDFDGPEFILMSHDGSMGWSVFDNVDDVLAHFGVRGMRWGVKRTPAEIHGDHANAAASAKKARKHGTKSLSNKELQDLITRMNLEQQYVKVAPPSRGVRFIRAGGKFTGDVLVNVGKQQATQLASQHATKLVGLAFKK